jgi:hypothetical protein
MTTGKKLWRNRKERKEWARRLQSEDPGLEVVHPHAAGIDVGNSAHYVAVRPDRDPEPVRRFECFTADLHHLADMLKYGQAYVDRGTEYYEHRFREQQIQLLTRKAAKFGLQITPIQA